MAGIESQGERFSQTRYLATLGVVFDRSRATDFIGTAAGMLQSPPMLLLPVWRDGGSATVYQAKTPWFEAWERFRESVTPIDYVLAPGTAADNILLTAWQVRRPIRSSWRTILNRFDTVDVLSAEARMVRRWPGGPIRGDFTASHGPDAELLGRFSLEAASEEGLAAMLDTAVRRIDAVYVAALQSGRLRSEAGLAVDLEPVIAPAPYIGSDMVGGITGEEMIVNGVEVAVVTPDGGSLSATEQLLRQTTGVTAVTVTSLSLGGTSRILISYTGDRAALQAALAARGLSIEAESGLQVLRRRTPVAPPSPVAAPAPAPVAAPAPAAPVSLLPRPPA